VQVAIFDPVRRLMKAGQSMNDEDSVRYPLQFFESLQNEGITVIFCHHDNKGSAKSGGGDALDMTGSGAWAGDADSILSVALPKGERRENPTQEHPLPAAQRARRPSREACSSATTARSSTAPSPTDPRRTMMNPSAVTRSQARFEDSLRARRRSSTSGTS
jgi:hypothetical protein